jgi:hypothetical protein
MRNSWISSRRKAAKKENENGITNNINKVFVMVLELDLILTKSWVWLWFWFKSTKFTIHKLISFKV